MNALRSSIHCFALALFAISCSSVFAAPAVDDPEGLPEHAVARFGTVHFRHGAPITAMAMSKDGKYLASGSGDRTLRIWESDTGKLLRIIRCESPYTTGITFSPDGKQIAADVDAENISIFEWQTDKQPRKIKATIPKAIVWSPDGKHIGCSVIDEDSILVFDAASGKQLYKIKGGERVAFSPDNKMFTIANIGGTIALHNVNDGKKFGELRPQEKSGIVWLQYSKTGAFLLASNDVGWVEVWDIKRSKRMQSFEGGGFAVFVPGDKAVAAIWENRVALFDLRSGQRTETSVDAWHSTPFLFAGDGNRIFVGGPQFRIAVWNRTTGKQENVGEGHAGEINGLAFGPLGDALLSTGADGVRLWSVKDNKELNNGRRVLSSQALALAPNARRFAVAHARAIHIWNPVDLTAAKPYPEQPAYKLKSKAEQIPFIAYTPDGERIAYPGGEKALHIADPGRGTDFAPLPLAFDPLAAAFGPNGRNLAVITRDGLLSYWSISPRGPGNVEPKDLELWKKRVQRAPRASVAISPNGLLIAASSVGRVLLLESVSGRQWYGFDRHLGDGGVQAIAFSPDGRLLAVGHGGSEGIVRIWEVLTAKEIVTLHGHAGGVNVIAFSPNGQRLASAGADSSILVWDLALPAGPDLKALTLGDAWNLLDSENAKLAYQAMGAMINAGEKAVTIIDAGLKGAIDNQTRVRKLIAQLDDDDFRVRKEARAQLDREGLRAWPAMHDALRQKIPQETERLIRLIIEGMQARGLQAPEGGLYGESLRTVRCINVLERIGTKEAIAVLQTLADVKDDSRVTQEAKAALERLRR